MFLEKNKMISWELIGPLFMLLTLFLTLISFSSPNYDLWAVAIVGFFLAWKMDKQGLMITLSIFLLVVILKHWRMSSNHLWQLGLEGSIALSLFLSYLGFFHLKEKIGTLEKSKKKREEENKELEEELKKEEQKFLQKKILWEEQMHTIQREDKEKIRRLISFENLIKALEQTIEEERKDRAILVQKIQEKERKNNLEIKDVQNISTDEKQGWKEEKKKLILQLEEKKQKINDNEQKLAAAFKKEQNIKQKEEEILFLQKKLDEKKFLLKIYEERFRQSHHIGTLYKQLKKQFEEKDDTLHLTRTSLFQLEEKLLEKKKEEENSSLSKAEEINQLEKEIFLLEKELLQADKENEILQKIVTHLTSELETEKSKEENKGRLSEKR